MIRTGTEPKRLGPAGRRLWRSWMAMNEPDRGEETLLEQAARTADELARLSEELAAGQVTVAGSTGQTRANPLLEEIRRHRALLATLLKQLAPPAASGAGGDVTAAARHAARKRWSGIRPKVIA